MCTNVDYVCSIEILRMVQYVSTSTVGCSVYLHTSHVPWEYGCTLGDLCRVASRSSLFLLQNRLYLSCILTSFIFIPNITSTPLTIGHKQALVLCLILTLNVRLMYFKFHPIAQLLYHAPKHCATPKSNWVPGLLHSPVQLSLPSVSLHHKFDRYFLRLLFSLHFAVSIDSYSLLTILILSGTSFTSKSSSKLPAYDEINVTS